VALGRVVPSPRDTGHHAARDQQGVVAQDARLASVHAQGMCQLERREPDPVDLGAAKKVIHFRTGRGRHEWEQVESEHFAGVPSESKLEDQLVEVVRGMEAHNQLQSSTLDHFGKVNGFGLGDATDLACAHDEPDGRSGGEIRQAESDGRILLTGRGRGRVH